MLQNRVQLVFLISLPLVYSIVAFYTYLGTFWFGWAKDVPFDFYNLVDESSILEACMVFFVASISYFFGWYMASKLTSLGKNRNIGLMVGKKIHFSRNLSLTIVFLNLFTILVYVYGYGLDGLISRPGYVSFENDDRNKALLVIHLILLPISVYSLAFVKLRYLRILLFIFHFIVLFSASTRLVGLIWFIYSLGLFARSGSKIKLRMFFYLSIGLYLFVWVLSIRNNQPHGFANNFEYLFLGNGILEFLSTGLNYVTSFSIYGLAYSIENKVADLDSLLLSINPLPSFFLDFEIMLESQRLLANAPVPMSAVAIIYSFGLPFLILFYSMVGLIAFFISFRLKTNSILGLAVVGVFLIGVFLSMQYNLRGFSRLLYVAIFLSIVSHYIYSVKLRNNN